MPVARNPLFSTYRQGENRVTGSMLAVFERVGVSVLERILAAATEEASLELVTFANQPPGAGQSVPDGVISAQFRYLIEVKTTSNALKPEQLEGHLACFDGSHQDERLLVITPDPEEPAVIAALNDERLVWSSFLKLSQAIDDLLGDPHELVSEQGRFLLRELQALWVEDGLIDHDDVVIVAARHAWPEYLRYSAYICQPDRHFRAGLSRMGFYTKKAIQPQVPAILWHDANVPITRDQAKAWAESDDPMQVRAAKLIAALIEDGSPREGLPHGIFLLSPPDDDAATLVLTTAVVNAATDKSGKPVAWTMGQRYTSTTALLRNPSTTEELDHGGG
jgi:hypothetical protein